MDKKFYGWWITLAAFFTFGLAVGIPYYGNPFFYDYYIKTFGWKLSDVTWGFPLAATVTLWVGPTLVHRFGPRKMIIFGTGCTLLAYLGWSQMTGDVRVYWALWILYMVGYIFSGPIPHQVLISQWFRKHRGKAMAVAYLGVGVFGGISQKMIAKPLTETFGFQQALMIIGGLMLLAWPIAFFVMRDKPSDMGQTQDGESFVAADVNEPPRDISYLVRQPAFWLLLIGSACSIGAIGSVNQHMKLVFKEQGFLDQGVLNTLSADATLYILFSSIAGRLVMGWAADKFPKKLVMSFTYLLVASTIPILLLVKPGQEYFVYVFSILFGFGMGADYMLIPLMAADRFGVNTLAKAMAIILPTDTLGQTYCPQLVSMLHDKFGGYGFALNVVIVLAFSGAAAVVALPKAKEEPR